MKTLQTYSTCFLVLLILLFSATATAVSQGRSSGRTRNPEQTNTGSGTATSVTRSEGSRDIGRTRSSETGSTPAPRSSETRVDGRARPDPPPVVVEIPSPPTPQPSTGGVYPPIRPPHLEHCVDVIWIDRPAPAEKSDGYWIRDAVRFGTDVALSDVKTMPEYSGYDFSELLKRPFDHPFTDMYVESDSVDLYMTVREDSDIMDLGSVLVPVDAIFILLKPWSADHSVCLSVGHEYVVRTWDHHYAKFMVRSLLKDRVIFDWAYQYGDSDREEISAIVPTASGGVKFSR